MKDAKKEIELGEEIQEGNNNSNKTKIGDTVVTVTYSNNNKSLMQLLEEYLYTI